jgi:hypothetical protein
LAACSSASTIVSKGYPPTNPASVRVLFQPPTEPFEQIASVSVHGVGAGSFGGNTDVAVGRRKEEAAKVGADAVILAGPATQSAATFGSVTGNRFGATGIAVSGGAGDAAIQGTAIKFVGR